MASDFINFGGSVGKLEKDIENEVQRAVPRLDNYMPWCNLCNTNHSKGEHNIVLPLNNLSKDTKDDTAKNVEAIIVQRTDLDAAVHALGILDAMQAKYLGPTHKARLETERLIKTLKGN